MLFSRRSATSINRQAADKPTERTERDHTIGRREIFFADDDEEEEAEAKEEATALVLEDLVPLEIGLS